MTNERALLNTIRMAALIKGVALVTPHDPGKPGWKLNEAGDAILLKDGNPIWVDSNGQESTLSQDTISKLNHEAMTNRKDLKTAQDALKAFEGIDAAAARKALETVGKLDQKQLIDAGEVDKVKDQITGQFKDEIKKRDDENASLRTKLQSLQIDNAFGSSEFVKDKLALPIDVARAYFSANITFDENGAMQIKDASGNVVRSKTKLGEVADFNEALSLLVENNPNRDALLKGGNHQGSGNNGGGGNGKPGMKTYRRAEIDKMAVENPAATQAAMEEVSKGNAQLID